MSNLQVVEKGNMADANKIVELSKEGIGFEKQIYTSRFSEAQEKVRAETWDVLMTEFLNQYIKPNDCILDLGAGDGLFIRRVKARHRIAVDLSTHVGALKNDGIEVHIVPGTQMSECISEKADLIFMSNFLEHMPDKATLLSILAECKRCLNPGGKVMILQPNIRYVGVKYWDYIDHHIALTEYSLKEALEINGFKIDRLVPQFLPYTAKSGVGKISSLLPTKLLVSIYLKVPILWRLFGAQTFVVAHV